jgi:hypothetical protein
MDEFTKKLTALRMGAAKAGGAAKSVAKGTLANMKRGLDGTAQKEMDEARKKRDSDMIRENFGSEENYRKTLGLDTKEGQDLFTPPYQKAGKAIGKAVKGAKGLFDRLVSVRGGGK